MGIKNLHQFLKRRCPQIYRTVPLTTYKQQIFAIDLSIYLFKYKIGYGNRWLDAFVQLVENLQKYEIRPIFVYDTKAPPEKEMERKLRSEARSKLKIKLEIIKKSWQAFKNRVPMNSNQEYEIRADHLWDDAFVQFVQKFAPDLRFSAKVFDDEIQKVENSLTYISINEFTITRTLFELYGISVIDSEGEAEATCSVFNKKKMVHAVMTDDTDVLAYGCPIMVTKMNFEEGTCTEINHQEILDELGMTSDQFLDFCIMCGTDYNTSINRIGCERSYKLIMECGSIEGIASTYPDLPLYVLNHIRMREIFHYELPYDYVIPMPASPDFPKLLEFCFIQNCQTHIKHSDLKTTDKDTKHVRIL